MTYSNQLKIWVEDEKKKGLVDIKVYPGNRSKASVESFAASILGFIASRKENRRTRIVKL